MNAIVITGVSSGIGLAAARHYIEAGRSVVGLARSATSKADALAGAHGPAPLLIDVDVQDPEALDDAAARVAAAGVSPRSVLAAAGVNFRSKALDIPSESVDGMMRTNVRGVFDAFRAFAPTVLATPAPRFIAIGSVAGGFGMQLRVMYSATKAALEGMARGLAIEWAPQGATVNVVAPGIVDTPLTRGYLNKNPGLEEQVVAATLASRLGTPEDVIAAVDYFDSPAASFVTGQTLVVDGGFSVGNTWW
ncbi:MAG: SDR family oxidoreductase [Bifidobacteriaceae bacterium]|jgi:NAD(P)-dependent dehydrogenase (short-subunit alcohol dehydrogenase family)|nr:SDR family oxidoreductase [Bifidobacteriaceae bacterium]